jgi:hypothetical protein
VAEAKRSMLEKTGIARAIRPDRSKRRLRPRYHVLVAFTAFRIILTA